MGKDTNFIKHTSCEGCGSSDANAVYSDGSAFCFSCKKTQGKELRILEARLIYNRICLLISLHLA